MLCLWTPSGLLCDVSSHALLCTATPSFAQLERRAAFLSAGGLWRAAAQGADREAQRTQASAVAETQRRVDAMSGQELDDLVADMLKVTEHGLRHHACSAVRSNTVPSELVLGTKPA